MTDFVALVGLLLVTLGSSGPGHGSVGKWMWRLTGDEAVLETRAAEANGSLLVRCSTGRAAVSLKWWNYAGTHPVLIMSRLGQSEPVTAWWPRAASRREVQYSGDHGAYLRGLRAGGTLSVVVSPDPVRMADASSDGVGDSQGQSIPSTTDVPLQMTFSLAGFGEAMAQAQGRCGP